MRSLRTRMLVVASCVLAAFMLARASRARSTSSGTDTFTM